MDPATLKLALAYGLDLGLGDPRWLPHPVRGLGWMIHRGEALCRSWIHNELVAGALLVAVVVAGTWSSVHGLMLLTGGWAPGASFVVEVALLYTCLSTRDLDVESAPVYEALRQGRLEEARKRVSMIVGRDTQNLTEPEVVRATVETIGESAMDGIVAPLFYAAIGGVSWACVYKAVNTLDSMIGYRSARYIRFGKVAARVDYWMNLIPAYGTAFFIALGSFFVGFSTAGSLKAASDAVEHGENSFIPEAALGGALGVQLGGTNFYQGKAVETPVLSKDRHPLNPPVIPQAIRVMYATSLCACAAALWVRWLFR